MAEDPNGIAAGPNGYAYVGGNPVDAIDPSGLDTYVINRDLARFGDSARSRNNPVTHTFAVTTTPDGSVDHTYSWGTDANLNGWTKDFPLDRKTAEEALRKKVAEKISGPQLDYFIAAAYKKLDKSENEHMNGIFFSSCKTEVKKLIERAYQMSSPY